MKHLVLGLALLTACGASTPAPSPDDQPTVKPVPSPVTAAGEAKATVDLTAVTLADDCGGTPPWGPPTAPVTRSEKQDVDAQPESHKSKSAQRRRCEQTAMQLAVTAPDGAATELVVKKVELFDDAGKSLGELTASSPTRWSNDAYQPWDQKVAPGQLSVSYVLSQPDWTRTGDRWNRTFTLKVTVGIGSADHSVHRDVEMISAPTSLPPNVKT
ncbi:MAG: hypothetical protein WKG01_11935 [Kofleriaceae bacterium]